MNLNAKPQRRKGAKKNAKSLRAKSFEESGRLSVVERAGGVNDTANRPLFV